jgi:hypothetical protein
LQYDLRSSLLWLALTSAATSRESGLAAADDEAVRRGSSASAAARQARPQPPNRSSESPLRFEADPAVHSAAAPVVLGEAALRDVRTSRL